MVDVKRNYESQVAKFIAKQPRNKLVITESNLKKLQFISLNLELSPLLKQIQKQKDFSFRAKELIRNSFSNNDFSLKKLGKYLAISDVGLLLERELQFDFVSFLDSYSQNTTLFLKWEGEISDNKLYFLTKENGLEIDISSLSYIMI